MTVCKSCQIKTTRRASARFNKPGDKPRNDFARSWLAFNYALDELLGQKPGDMRRWYNKGLKPELTRRFLNSLQFDPAPKAPA